MIYKNAADATNDTLSMYRIHKIYFSDYNKFNIKQDRIRSLFYLFKAFTYSEYKILNRDYFLFRRIDIFGEIYQYFLNEDSKIEKFDKLIQFLIKYSNEYQIKETDIKLIDCIFKFIYKNNLGTQKECIKNLISLCLHLKNKYPFFLFFYFF